MDVGKNIRPGNFAPWVRFFTNDSGVGMGENFIGHRPRGGQGGSLLVAVGTKQAREWGKILLAVFCPNWDTGGVRPGQGYAHGVSRR